ncbi:hypothetical protein [Amycolatopsis jejuensis]|uniref:hypothetical protein n=1 Tax=Amycolatopsis jejuensis TaxID=330084 RepID=UPI000AF46B8E|nr:hypothetical protein [Amycolatopsis jejuensis]
MTRDPDHRASSRARVRLLIAVLASLAAVAALVVVAHHRTTPPGTPSPPLPPSAAVGTGRPPGDAATTLATRPMTWLPAQAAQPHSQTTRTAGPSITLPAPSLREGRWIPDGFPATPEGALAQLVAFNQAGVSGGDPDTYDRAYAVLALPGAPPVAEAGLHVLLREFRAAAHLDPGEMAEGLVVRYEITHGLIKGSAEDGRYVVACTLGQFTADYHGYGTSVGVGDCQALRWTGAGWRISPGARAAYAASAWPGTSEAVDAGYRALDGAR